MDYDHKNHIEISSSFIFPEGPFMYKKKVQRPQLINTVCTPILLTSSTPTQFMRRGEPSVEKIKEEFSYRLATQK